MGQSNAVQFDLLGPSGVVTHVISDPSLRTATGLDLERIRSYPEVQFAALLEGGMMALGCPDGLPDALTDIAESLDIAPSAAPQDAIVPPQTSTLDQQMLDFSQKLDDFMSRQHTHDVLSARMEAFEATLRETIARQDASLIAADQARAQSTADLQALYEKMDQQLDTMSKQAALRAEDQTNVADALAQMREQIIDHFDAQNANVDLAPVLSAIENVAQKAQTASEATGGSSAALADLNARLDQIAAQPAPQLDLTQQRQSFTQFQSVLGTIIKRFEGVADKFDTAEQPSEPAYDFAELAGQFKELPLLVAETVKSEMTTAELRVDLSGVEEELSRLGQTPVQLPASFDAMVEQLTALQKRPDPVLDLTEQRRSFANFTTVFGAAIARIEAMSDKLSAHEGPQATPVSLQNVEDRLNRIEALLSDQASTSGTGMGGLTDAIRHLADQMQPHADIETKTSDGPKSDGEAAQTTAVQDAFIDDLRVTFAELLASQIKAQDNST